MAGDFRFHLETAGSPRNPAVVALHGFMGTGADWSTVMAALAGERYGLSPALPGHGKTRCPEGAGSWRMEQVAAALALELARRGIAQTDLIGYSMGGRLGLHLALHCRARVRRLVLESASPGLSDGDERIARRRQDDTLARRLETEPLERFLRDWYDQPMFAGLKRVPEEFAGMLERRRAQDGGALARALREMGTGAQEPQWDRLADAPPTLLIVGAEDAKFREIAARMAERMPGARVATVAGAGHAVHVEQPARFVELVQEFLSG